VNSVTSRACTGCAGKMAHHSTENTPYHAAPATSSSGSRPRAAALPWTPWALMFSMPSVAYIARISVA
jgi:hypothetical protein